MTKMADDEDQELHNDLVFIERLIYGNWLTQVTSTFAELGIADVLYSRAQNIEQLATILNVDKGYLKRFLRCAANLDFLTYNAKTGLYHLLNRGRLLSSTHPKSKREEARLNGADYRYQPWGNLLNILRYGAKEEFSSIYKKGSLEYLKDKPMQMETFHKAMTSISKRENAGIINDYDFSRFAQVVDIGSGEGSLIKAILDKEPDLHGCMFDLYPFGVAEMDDEEDLYKKRLIRKQGNFFDKIPDDADLYIMKNIVHNWPEDKAKKILEKARDAMLSQAGSTVHPVKKRLLIIERLLTETNEYNVANWMDLNFMVLLGGAERTVTEYKELAAQCGLSLKQSIKTASGRYILEFALASGVS